MIFSPESIEKIRRQEKTQTRRVANGPCTYRVGGDYSVQPGRTKSAVCRILVTGVRREKLYDITPADVRAEGFRSINEFFRVFNELNGNVRPDTLVDVIDFELADGDIPA